jgi:hypothetical protein
VLRQGVDRFETIDVPVVNDGSFLVVNARLEGRDLFIRTLRPRSGDWREVLMRWNGTRYPRATGQWPP